MILWCDWDAEDNDGWHRGHMNDYEDHERRIEVAIAYVHDQKEKAEKKKQPRKQRQLEENCYYRRQQDIKCWKRLRNSIKSSLRVMEDREGTET